MTSAPEDPTDVRSPTADLRWLATLLVLTAVLAGLDLVFDTGDGVSIAHATVEGAIMLAGVLGLVILGRRFARARRSEHAAHERAGVLAADLERAREDAQHWRAEAAEIVAGLGVLIDRQFVRWGLSTAEKEVAMLLLKGLSHKEIATVREVGVATARQQATAIYRKAGLAGRHDLAAFFLEDLLPPRAAAERSGPGA